MNKHTVLTEIKGFLEGYNNDLKYIVNVETDPRTNIAECIIHEPNREPRIENIRYEPFMYMKDLSKTKYRLYDGVSEEYVKSKQIKYGITITKLKTGNQKRLVEGYCYKITSYRSYNDIINYLRDGGIDPYEKLCDDDGNPVKDVKGDNVFPHRDLFYSPRTTEQFFISTQSRLFKGFEEYKNIHKVTFDIETTGLRYQVARVFAIGVRDNRGFETILEVDKRDDDESEIRLIQDFFNLINYLNPAIILGHNSETFDFDFILGRVKILKMDLSDVPTSLNKKIPLRRRGNVSVKYGNTADKYTATEMWGFSVIDTLHAAKRTAAVNSDLKGTGLKYIAKFEKIARPNRTYIEGEDNTIGRYYIENNVFLIDEKNNHVEIPKEFQHTAKLLYKLQANKNNVTDQQYKELKNKYLREDNEFVNWFKAEALPKNLITFIGGRKLVKQYLLDDLWETEQVDELYNQSSFMLAKIVPTTYQRICTMGTAAIWNLLLTAWSYENDLAVPVPDKYEKFSGGLARCYKTGYSKRIVKIDYASLYPMIQLTWNVFPMFDITGVIKKMLLYLTTTRNIYKKLGSGKKLDNEEVELLKQIDPEIHSKYTNGKITTAEELMAKIKQLPIKILNNSLFGALGSNISFNWSDNNCAARITCIGRLQLRHAIKWFSHYKCIALLAVTDGINFMIPDTTTIKVTEEGVFYDQPEGLIEDMWKFGGEVGVAALIEKFNYEEMIPPYMSVDNDGESISCLNLSRINYATLTLAKDMKTGEMKEKTKLTGNTIKSKVMPEYIEEFIDKGLNMILHGQGSEFIKYYNEYAEDIFYKRIPLKKIASKSKIKTTLSAYKKRGQDKNGRDKGMQAHMELLIEKREQIAEKLFEEHKDKLNLEKIKKNLTIDDKMKLIANYMPAEPELDSVVYYVNSGYKKSHGDSRKIVDKITGKERYCATLISAEDLLENPSMTGDYNYEKYLDAFNKRVETILVGFDPEIRKSILAKINKKGELVKTEFNPLQCDLSLKNFNEDDFDESMYLEELEVDFWNKTGYDPRTIWDGFMMHDDCKVYYEIYENALNFLNEKMIAANKPTIKSISSDYKEGDMILVKDGSEYHVGLYNGVYVQIIRSNVEIPKSELELELDRKREENLKKLETSELVKKSNKELFLESQDNKRKRYFNDFKKQFALGVEFTLDILLADPEGEKMIDIFIENVESRIDEEAEEYEDMSDGNNEY